MISRRAVLRVHFVLMPGMLLPGGVTAGTNELVLRIAEAMSFTGIASPFDISFLLRFSYLLEWDNLLFPPTPQLRVASSCLFRLCVGRNPVNLTHLHVRCAGEEASLDPDNGNQVSELSA